MAFPIDSVGAIQPGAAPASASISPRKTESTGFGDTLASALESVADSERGAEQATVAFANADPDVGIHEVVIAAERASISLRYAATMKNRLIEAYRELMNTQV
jgi:flagellar hook-basal body complex protein FliE